MHPEKKNRIKSMLRKHEILEVSTILPVPSRKSKWQTLSRDLQSKESCRYIFTSWAVLFLFLRYQSTLKNICFDLCMCVCARLLICMSTTSMKYLQRPEEGARYPQLWNCSQWRAPKCGYWKPTWVLCRSRNCS